MGQFMKPKLMSIIAACAMLLHGSLAAAAPSHPAGSFKAYQVQLEIMRNGVELANPDSTLRSGESNTVQIGKPGQAGGVRLNQRVTAFPGAGDFKALLQLELYSRNGSTEKRFAAPTFGIKLGRSEQFHLNTEMGRVSIRATVKGLQSDPTERASTIQTQAYPGI